MLKRSGELRLVGVAVVVALVSAVALVGTGFNRSVVHVLDVGAWVRSVRAGSVQHVNGATGKIDESLSIPIASDPGVQLVNTPHGAALLNRDTGKLQMINNAQLHQAAPPTTAGQGGDVELVSNGTTTWLVQPKAGTASTVSPATGVPVALHHDVASAAVDGHGRLWAATGNRVTPVADNGKPGDAVTVGNPGDHVDLTASGGSVYAYDQTSQTLTVLGVRSAPSVPLPIAPGTTGVVAANEAGSSGGSVDVVVPSAGVVVRANPQGGSTQTIRLPGRDGHDLGGAVTLGSALLVPDHTTGELLVVNPQTDSTRAYHVTPPSAKSGAFDLEVKNGIAYANDPTGNQCLVVTSGPGGIQVTYVVKYRAATPAAKTGPTPSPSPNAPSQNPPSPSAPPSPSTTREPAPSAPTTVAPQSATTPSVTAPQPVEGPQSPTTQPTTQPITPQPEPQSTVPRSVQSPPVQSPPVQSPPVQSPPVQSPAATVVPQATVPRTVLPQPAHPSAPGSVHPAAPVPTTAPTTSTTTPPTTTAPTTSTTTRPTTTAPTTSTTTPPTTAAPATPPPSVAAPAPKPPAPPTAVTASAGDGTITVNWTPAPPAGNPATSYLVSWGGTVSQQVAGTSTTITGLTNGQAYHVTVAARNAAGTSSAVTATPDPVTPRAAVPGPPTGITVKPGNSSATVRWTAPAGAVKDYQVTTQPSASSQPVVVPAGTTSVTLANLTNGTSYGVTVTAVGPSGGTSSATGGPFTPFGPPGAVSGISVSQSGATSLAVSFGGAAANGSVISDFRVTATGGGATVTNSGMSSPIALNGLTVGATYTISVQAENAAGSGPATSAGSYQVGVVATVSVSVSAGSQSATVNVSVATNGDPAPSGCVVEYSGSTTQGACGAISISGLTAGQSYSFDAYALVNGVASARSSSASATPYYLTNVGHTLDDPTTTVDLHSGPSQYDPVMGKKTDGDQVQVMCQTTGNMVYGTVSGQSNVWDQLASGYWIADLYVDTPNSLNGTFSSGIAQCG